MYLLNGLMDLEKINVYKVIWLLMDFQLGNLGV